MAAPAVVSVIDARKQPHVKRAFGALQPLHTIAPEYKWAVGVQKLEDGRSLTVAHDSGLFAFANAAVGAAQPLPNGDYLLVSGRIMIVDARKVPRVVHVPAPGVTPNDIAAGYAWAQGIQAVDNEQTLTTMRNAPILQFANPHVANVPIPDGTYVLIPQPDAVPVLPLPPVPVDVYVVDAREPVRRRYKMAALPTDTAALRARFPDAASVQLLVDEATLTLADPAPELLLAPAAAVPVPAGTYVLNFRPQRVFVIDDASKPVRVRHEIPPPGAGQLTTTALRMQFGDAESIQLLFDEASLTVKADTPVISLDAHPAAPVAPGTYLLHPKVVPPPLQHVYVIDISKPLRVRHDLGTGALTTKNVREMPELKNGESLQIVLDAATLTMGGGAAAPVPIDLHADQPVPAGTYVVNWKPAQPTMASGVIPNDSLISLDGRLFTLFAIGTLTAFIGAWIRATKPDPVTCERIEYVAGFGIGVWAIGAILYLVALFKPRWIGRFSGWITAFWVGVVAFSIVIVGLTQNTCD